MGVRTTADEHIESAKNHINEAIRHLSQVVVHECWGHNEYSNDYWEKLDNVFSQLRQANRLL